MMGVTVMQRPCPISSQSHVSKLKLREVILFVGGAQQSRACFQGLIFHATHEIVVYCFSHLAFPFNTSRQFFIKKKYANIDSAVLYWRAN